MHPLTAVKYDCLLKSVLLEHEDGGVTVNFIGTYDLP